MHENTLEVLIRDWRNELESIGYTGDDLEKVKVQLVEEISGLREKGLTESEAFIIATRRIGEIHEFSRNYFVNINKLWKRLSKPVETDVLRHSTWLTIALALMAALLSQTPYLFGGSYSENGGDTWFMFVSFWLLPSLVTYFVIRHHISLPRILAISFAYALIFLFVALYPFASESSTRILVIIHLPFLNWLMLLPLTGQKTWNSISAVNYLRFSGEAFLYAVLVGLGGGALMALTVAIFSSASINIEQILAKHIGVAGFFGIPIIAVVLADQKRQFVENFAPILARIFIPLFFVSIVSFLLTIAAIGTKPSGDRELLLVMNILLLLVVAMLFYDVSARDNNNTRRVSDWANLALIATALVLDGVVLSAISSRLLEFGVSPNRVALFGLNIILIVHLLILITTYLRYITKRIPFQVIESAVARMLPVYGIWLFVIVVIFPVLFAGA